MRLAPLLMLAAVPAFALDDPQTKVADPFASGMWPYHQVTLYGDPAQIAWDERVRVLAPDAAEDPFHVPVIVDARAIPEVVSIAVSVDYGPVPRILTYYPEGAAAKLAFRFKIDQATPIRAVVTTADGAVHVGGARIGATGGGCTAPAAAYASADWEERLGEVRGRVWPELGRARFMVSHPMDTGLADGIPVFIIERLDISNAAGERLARIELHEPVEEDPAFTLWFDGNPGSALRIEGRDNNGNEIGATIAAAATE